MVDTSGVRRFCNWCGGPLKPQDQRFCSPQCNYLHKEDVADVTRFCIFCGERFSAKPWLFYCLGCWKQQAKGRSNASPAGTQ
jgi:predicted nucleic acid-binding Zn ribbon protein